MIQIYRKRIIAYTLAFSLAYLFGPASAIAGGEFFMVDWMRKGMNKNTEQKPVLLTKDIKDHPTKEISDQPTKDYLREDELKRLDEQLKALKKRKFELNAAGAEETEEIEPEGMGLLRHDNGQLMPELPGEAFPKGART